MAPKFRVYAHVASFGSTFLLFTGCAIGYAMIAGKSEEDKIAQLRQLYPDVNNKRSENNKNMQIIFDKMKKGEDINEFKDVLKGGKGDKKQHENLQKVEKK